MPQNNQDKGILSYLNTEENSMALSLMSSGYADYSKGGIGLITGIFKLLVGSIMAFFSVGPSNVSKI